MSDDYAVRVKGLTKEFVLPHQRVSTIKSKVVSLFRKYDKEKQLAVNGVSFEIKKGEFFGIVGRNGSGKSTLLKCLAGVYTPNHGSVHVTGKLVPFIELGVGFNPELSGRDNVYLNGALLGFGKKQMESMYEDIVAFAELEDFMDQALKNYSSGMQVRLAFSIAIRAQGDVLLLDEVLAVGDANFQQKCYDYFEELKRQNKTVILVSHNMDAVKRFCTKAIYLREGRLTAEGKAVDIADEYIEENIDNPVSNKDSATSVIQVQLLRQLKDSLELELRYSSKIREKMYAGISIQRDGISLGEINTAHLKPLVGKGKIWYTLDTSSLNNGAYRVAVALFQTDNQKLVAVGNSRPEFAIKGSDITRGGSLRLPNTWRYESEKK